VLPTLLELLKAPDVEVRRHHTHVAPPPLPPNTLHPTIGSLTHPERTPRPRPSSPTPHLFSSYHHVLDINRW
jgi:hypothetical protein